MFQVLEIMKINSISSAAVLLSSTVSAFKFGKPPPDIQVHVIDGFPWKNPFNTDAISSFEPVCQKKVNFNAMEYTLHDLMKPAPEGLKPWANGLKKVFSGREYPGGWTGLDHHLHDRSLLMMDYKTLPIAVRQWIEEEERSEGKGQGLFAVFEKPKDESDIVSDLVEFPSADKIDRSQDESKIVIFAPGAVYGILPLWAAEASDCKGKCTVESNDTIPI